MPCLRTVVDIMINSLEQASDTDLGVAQKRHVTYPDARRHVWENGVGSNQADRVWSDRITLAAAAQTLDLAGALTSKLDGTTVTFVEVVAIYIFNRATASGYTLTVGNATAPVTTIVGASAHTIKVGAGGELLLTSPIDGFGVTATTADGLKLDPGANTFDVDVIIIGRSA